MGKYDSTQTRVTPVFGSLARMRSPWLDRLLALPSSGHRDHLGWSELSMQVDELRYGSDEKPLPSPTQLLHWLIAHAEDVTGKGLQGTSAHTTEQRRRLLARDSEVIVEARAQLASSRFEKQWFVLEGPSYPDVFISTPDLVVVIEGKRTESGPTTSTTWMRGRHQMLRHMDGAFEMANGRSVIGFFVVHSGDDAGAPEVWKKAAAETISPTVLARSLPHRTATERALIARGFLGVTTWLAICRKFGIDPQSLPDTV